MRLTLSSGNERVSAWRRKHVWSNDGNSLFRRSTHDIATTIPTTSASNCALQNVESRLKSALLDCHTCRGLENKIYAKGAYSRCTASYLVRTGRVRESLRSKTQLGELGSGRGPIDSRTMSSPQNRRQCGFSTSSSLNDFTHIWMRLRCERNPSYLF